MENKVWLLCILRYEYSLYNLKYDNILVPVGNGGSTETYTWTQSLDDVTVSCVNWNIRRSVAL